MEDLFSSEVGKAHIKNITWVDRGMCNFLLNRYPEISYENTAAALKYYSRRLVKIGNPPSEPLTGHLDVVVFEPLGVTAAQCTLAARMMAEFTIELTKLTDEMNAGADYPSIKTEIDIIKSIPKLGDPLEIEPVRNAKIAGVTGRVSAMDVVVYCLDEGLIDVDHLECVIGALSFEQYFILAVFCDIGKNNSLRVLGEFYKRLRALKNKFYTHTKKWILWCVKCNVSAKTILNFGELKNFLLHYEVS
ncbi:hypothetical protein Aperf_G00000130728 [Anoplocephala perfoliata]